MGLIIELADEKCRRRIIYINSKESSYKMHLWRRLGIVQVNLASALALHKRSYCAFLYPHRPSRKTPFPATM